MSAEQNRIDELEKANAELSRSLKHCRELTSEFRAKLVANQIELPSEEPFEATSRPVGEVGMSANE
jgi:hypothetical protein